MQVTFQLNIPYLLLRSHRRNAYVLVTATQDLEPHLDFANDFDRKDVKNPESLKRHARQLLKHYLSPITV